MRKEERKVVAYVGKLLNEKRRKTGGELRN